MSDWLLGQSRVSGRRSGRACWVAAGVFGLLAVSSAGACSSMGDGWRVFSRGGFGRGGAFRAQRSRLARSLALFCVIIGTIGAAAVTVCVTTASASPPRVKRPIYVFTHNLNAPDQVAQAMRAGYNAIETDVWYGPMPVYKGGRRHALTAPGWWATEVANDHPNFTKTPHPRPLVEVLAQMREARRRGKNLAFVWLDVKNTPSDMTGLQQRAHRYLTAWGLPVMYQFYPGQPGGSGWKSIKKGLGPREGVSIETDYGKARRDFDQYGSGIDLNHRVWDSRFDCDKLKDFEPGVQDRGRGELAKVFAFTVTFSTPFSCVDFLLGTLGVDGLIAGFDSADYTANALTKVALINVLSYLHDHHQYRLATRADNPWRSARSRPRLPGAARPPGSPGPAPSPAPTPAGAPGPKATSLFVACDFVLQRWVRVSGTMTPDDALTSPITITWTQPDGTTVTHSTTAQHDTARNTKTFSDTLPVSGPGDYAATARFAGQSDPGGNLQPSQSNTCTYPMIYPA